MTHCILSTFHCRYGINPADPEADYCDAALTPNMRCEAQNTWVYHSGVAFNDPASKYTVALYWALQTMTTVRSCVVSHTPLCVVHVL